jgi:predicted Zn-dependent protease
LTLLLFLSACATGDMLGNFNLISPEEEQQLGAQLHQSITQQSNIIQDPAVQSYVEAVGGRLAAVSQDPNRGYQFHVIEDPGVNAFAIPGGHLYVQTGLIQAAESEAELASVMAHELGHAEERHPTERLSRTYGTQMLLNMVLGENPGQLQAIAGNLIATGGISAYSRSAENEADRIGVYLLNRAGYDPGALASFFEKLAQLEQQSGGPAGSTFFSTHPPTPDRIANVNALIQGFGAERATGSELVGNFGTIQTRVASLTKR